MSITAPHRKVRRRSPRLDRYQAAVNLDKAAMRIRNELRNGHPDERQITMLLSRVREAAKQVQR